MILLGIGYAQAWTHLVKACCAPTASVPFPLISRPRNLMRPGRGQGKHLTFHTLPVHTVFMWFIHHLLFTAACKKYQLQM